MLTEFYEDKFEDDPNAMLHAAKGEDGEVVFEETGDPLIDKWEKELAMGLTPDLTEGMSKKDKAILEKEKIKGTRARKLAAGLSDIDQRFAESIKNDPRYAVKTLGSND